MKNITYQLEDREGEILVSKNLTINDGDKLIMQYDTDIISQKIARKVFKYLENSIENGECLIPIPKGIELQVLRVE